MIKKNGKEKYAAVKTAPQAGTLPSNTPARIAPAANVATASPPTQNALIRHGRPDSRVCLELIKPDAQKVFVAGSFNGWKPEKTPLVRQGNGSWVGDLTISPGRYEYLFVADGQWLPDPKAKESVQNPYGGKNSVLVVGG
jgi:hypothetical protein